MGQTAYDRKPIMISFCKCVVTHSENKNAEKGDGIRMLDFRRDGWEMGMEQGCVASGFNFC